MDPKIEQRSGLVTMVFPCCLPTVEKRPKLGKHIVSAVWEKRELDQQDLKIILTVCIHMVPWNGGIILSIFLPRCDIYSSLSFRQILFSQRGTSSQVTFFYVFQRYSSSMSFRIIEAKHLQALHEGGKRSSWIAAQMLTNLAPATGIDM